MRRHLIIFFFMIPFYFLGQDVHFTQFNKSKFFLNPSLLFIAEKDYKISLQRRSQWNTVGDPYNTFTVSIERKNISPKNSFGLQVLNDVAGEAEFKTAGLSVIYAREFFLDKKNNINLGFGLGYFQRSIDFDKLIFQEVENYPNSNFWFPEINIGASNMHIINKKSYIISGISFFHLNKPNQSFVNNDKVRLDSKMNLHSLSVYSFNEKIDLSPSILFSKQKNSQEAVFVFEVIYNPKIKNTKLKSAFGYRWEDAIIYNFGIEKDDFEFSISYDVNISSFNQATNGHGGIEFFLSYIWEYKRNKDLKKIIHIETCPKYL